MAETIDELLYLPHHRERQRFKGAERTAGPEANDEILEALFDQAADLSLMPTQDPDRLRIVAEADGDKELIMYQICQCRTQGLVFTERIDCAMLVRRDDVIAIVEYARVYYRGIWRRVRQPDELQFHWERDYNDGPFSVCDATFTDEVADFHGREITAEIDRRAYEQRLRYMVGVVAMSPLIH